MKARSLLRSFGPVLLLLAAGAAGLASAQPPLPAAATPGGALPQPPAEAGLPQVRPEVFPIPPAVQRPLGVEEGDRVFVAGFRLSGVRERPGIDPAELAALVERLRVERQQLAGVGKDGFTDEERARALEFMRQVVESPDLDLKIEEYQALVDGLRVERLRRAQGLTIGELQQIAAEVTQYYRRAGFVVAQAFVPAQEVQDGQVTIEVVEGELGQVLVQGNQRYSEQMLLRPFGDLVNEPVVDREVETALSILSDYPGLTAFGVFKPGQAPGTSDLVVNVQEEDRLEGLVRIDNHGSRFTGERRLWGGLTLNNPLGRADRLDLILQQAYRPKNGLFGSVDYELPLFGPRTFLGAGYEINSFDVGREFEVQDISGESRTANLFLRQTFLRSRVENLYGKAELVRERADVEQLGALQSRDELAYVGLELAYDAIQAGSASIHSALLRFDHGLDGVLGVPSEESVQTSDPPPSRETGSDRFVGSDFDMLSLHYTRLTNLAPHQSLLMRLQGQYSWDPLVSVRQLALGGPDTVRAFPVSEFLFDTGYFASLEWTVDAPGFAEREAFAGHKWGELLRFSLFADYGRGWLNDPAPSDIAEAEILGAGLGVRFGLPGRFDARLQVAHPIGADEPSDGRSTHYWLDFTYSF